MNFAIETHHLSKHYGPVQAVVDLSLQVNRGEIYAFLGLNGAGKTSTIRMILGMIRPNAGKVYILGQAIRHSDAKPWDKVGYMVETPHAYPELSVRENLEACRLLRPGTDSKAVDRAIEQLGLDAFADRRADHLSHGNKQRLGLAKALLHQPELIVLDEPANGLDPAGIIEVRNLLRSLVNERGATVFMSSHILGEVARLADRIGIIHKGHLLQEMGLAELELNRKHRLLVNTLDDLAARAVLETSGFTPEITADGTLEIKDDDALAQPERIATRLVNAGYAPTMLLVEHEDLEDYFMRLIGTSPGDEA
jgi:ABC-2 type transport system ATP-binding protein